MPLGSTVKIDGPSGSLTLHNNVSRTAVFPAGGSDIKPFRSIVFRAAEEKISPRIFLFYSNRRPEDAPFVNECQGLEKETGLIDKEMRSSYLNNSVSTFARKRLLAYRS